MSATNIAAAAVAFVVAYFVLCPVVECFIRLASLLNSI